MVVASPSNVSAGPRKFKRKRKEAPAAESGAGATPIAPAPAPTTAAAAAAAACPPPAALNQRQRRGDDEFERQLQMALLATREGGAVLATTEPGEPGGPTTAPSPHSPCTSTPAAQRPASLFWAEVFFGSSSDGAWVHADGFAGVVGAPAAVEASGRAKPTLGYVAAFLGGAVKDVTRRYAASYVKTLRARDEKWFAEVMKPLRSTVRAPPLL